MLVPILISLLSLLHLLLPAHSFVQQQFMTPATVFGLVLLCGLWFLYFSGYRYAREILLVQGALSLVAAGWILASYLFHFGFPLEHLTLPPDSPFMLNLGCMFMAGYLIQVLYYWLPRTKLLINISLAIILFMALLSIFGHVYNLNGINLESLLLPMPFGAILSYIVLTLVIFAHTNHMERLYLNRKIILGFALMFVAIVGANVVVYKNVSKTLNVSAARDTGRDTLTEIYQADFYLSNTRAEAQTYENTGDTQYIALYHANKQAYLQSIARLEGDLGKEGGTGSARESIATIAELGRQILSLGDSATAQKQSKSAPTTTRSAIDKSMDMYMDQVFNEIKAASLAYTSQLDKLVDEESQGGRGIILGISIASALSILMLLFTPLFIRQTIQKLSRIQAQLEHSNGLLAEETSRVEAILTSVGDGLFVVDAHRLITVFNHAAEQITGLKRQAVLGQRYDEVMQFASPAEPGSELDFTEKALQGVVTQLSHNAVLQRGQSEKIDVQVSAAPVKSKTGSVVGAIIVFRDRSSEQALENAKDEFLSLASHQLRTPATATKQFLAMFLQGYAGHIDDKQRLFLQQAYDNNELGINIIEELLNITRLENDTFKVITEKIELTQFLRTSIEQHMAYAKRGKQMLHLEVPSVPVYIEADASLLGMAIDNLITNALKYSDEGDTVTIRLTDGKKIEIAVSDTGIGIKKEDMPKIFERFNRLEDPQKRNVSGTGIGLYLVKKIVKQLHATIRADSEYGKGSTFILTFKPTD